MLNQTCLLGCDESHVRHCHPERKLQTEVCAAFSRLAEAGKREGFDIRIASAYRSFDKQHQIWDAKVSGKRQVLDDFGGQVDVAGLGDKELVWAILRWSALPGTSRHHWGTDFDIYDAAALAEGKSFELTLAETQLGGIFCDMYLWLECYLEGSSEFFRPYRKDLGGVGIEPWHLSYFPLSDIYQKQLKVSVLRSFIETKNLALKSTVLLHLDEIFEQFVTNISEPSNR